MTDQRRTSHPYWLWESIMETPEVLKKYLDEDFQREVDRIAEVIHQKNPRRVFVSGTGSSNFVALAEVFAFEQIAGYPATAYVTTELSAQPPLDLDSDSLWVFNSHSGGTIGDADAIEVAKERGAFTLGITDIPDSTLAQLVDEALIGPGGPKHELPATRTYAAALFRTILLAAALAKWSGNEVKAGETLASLEKIPAIMREVIDRFEVQAPAVVEQLMDCTAFIVVGSGPNVATIHEGALGLSQSRGVPAQGFPTENWLHGPIQTLTKEMCVITIAAEGPLQTRVLHAAEAAKIIGASVVVLGPKDAIQSVSADVIFEMPDGVPEVMSPLLYIPPLWQIGYHFSLKVGHDADRLSMEIPEFQEAMAYLMRGDRKFGA
jgi:glucosamine--fructose-6-phosphate aminotransferase (isomerizing)